MCGMPGEGSAGVLKSNDFPASRPSQLKHGPDAVSRVATISKTKGSVGTRKINR